MNRKNVFVVFAAILALASADRAADSAEKSAEKSRDKSVVFNVPTSGKIMDVIYTPEFDEWWVKCREGDTIVVYTYDRRSKGWGRVLFAPKPPEEAVKKPGKPESATAGTETFVPDGREAREAVPDEAGKAATDAHKPDSTKAAKPEKKKWWDPMTIIKKGEQLIRPLGSEGKKDGVSDEDRKLKP